MNLFARKNRLRLASLSCLSCFAFPLTSLANTDQLISRLSAPKIQERKQAEKDLLRVGDPAIEPLKAALAGDDPEIALRAEVVINKIELGIQPDDPPELITLIEQFYNMSAEQQKTELAKLRKQKKYRLNVLLAERAKDPIVQSRLRASTVGDAILEARTLIAAGNITAAESWLRKLSANNATLTMPLAFLLQQLGTATNEIEIVKSKNDKISKKFLAELYCVSGDREQAIRLAQEINDTSFSVVIDLLNGNFQPLLDTYSQKNPSLKPYCSLVESARNAQPPDEKALQLLLKAKGHNSASLNYSTIASLYSLGYDQKANQYLKNNNTAFFNFYANQERDEEALLQLGIKTNGQSPDYQTYIKAQLKQLSEREQLGDTNLLSLLSWLERRGCFDVIDRDVIPALTELAKEKTEMFDFLSSIILSNANYNSPYHAPLTIAKVYEAIAPEDEIAWKKLLEKSSIGRLDISSGQDTNAEILPWWTWLGELEPQLKYAERFRLLVKCFSLASDPAGERDKILHKIAAWHKNADEDTRKEKRPVIELLQRAAPSKILAAIAPAPAQEIQETLRTKQWLKAADAYAKLAEANPENPTNLIQQAVCLRMAGKTDDAALLEKNFSLLVLGDSVASWFAAQYYAQYNMQEDALAWSEKALYLTRPSNASWAINVQQFAQMAMDSGKWKLASALYEASLIKTISIIEYSISDTFAAILYRTRMAANMAHGFALVASDRKSSVKLLKQCHNSLMADASLADHFFPGLRRCGMLEEHNQWFEESWAAMTAQRERYPDYDNIYNSMAWLASRARLRLDEAQTFSQKSMQLRPDTFAYADTMAEVHFAKGDRQAATHWSDASLFLAQASFREDPEILSQNFKFHHDPLPEPPKP